MRSSVILAMLCLAAALLHPGTSSAQDTNESRLRDAVRQAVTEMRAAQDQAAQAQADLAKAQADSHALQTQLDAANAKLAEGSSKPKAPPADTAGLETRLRDSLAQYAALQQMNAKLQSGYRGAADQARANGSEVQQLQAAQHAETAHLQICKATNTKLIDAAEQVLHLYESQSFRSLLLRSYEPVLGASKVKLENIIQDYDDKIHDQEYVPPPHSPK